MNNNFLPYQIKKNSEQNSVLSSQLAESAEKITPTINTLANYALQAKNGSPVVIGCWGDSTYWGHASGIAPLGTQVSTPPPLALQNILRSYFNNNNIVVNNHGIKGQSTQAIMDSWNTSMASNTENIIYINWGINDSRGLTPETYRQNLRTIIETAKKYGKTIICDIPNIVIAADYANDGMATYDIAQGLKPFVQVMRDVAKEYGCYQIDNYVNTQQYTYNKEYIPDTIPDGMHPGDAMYNYKALNMALPFLAPNITNVDSNSIISCVDPSVIKQGSSAVQIAKNSRTGFALMADNIKVAINIIEQCDLYLAVPAWDSGSSSMQIKLDNTEISRINIAEGYNPNTGYLHDMAVLIGENLPKGIHFIELNNVGTGSVGLNYVMTKPPLKKKLITGKAETNGVFSILQPLSLLENLEFNNVSATQSQAIFDIVTSRMLKDLDVEITATLADGEGFSLMVTKRSDVLSPNTLYPAIGAVLVYSSGGNLNVTGGTQTGYGTPTVLTTADGLKHVYRIVVTTGNVARVYVDGVQKGSDVPLSSSRIIGGYFGLWKTTAGTMKVDKVVVR